MDSWRHLISIADRENAEVEIFRLKRDIRSIRVARNEIIEAQNMIEEGSAIRVAKDGGKGYAITSKSDRDSLEKCFRSALSMAKMSRGAHNWLGFPKKVNHGGKGYAEWLCDEELASMPPDAAAELVLRMIREASSDGQGERSLTAVLIVLLEEFSILNSQGLEHLGESSSAIYSRTILEARKDVHYSTATNQFCSRKLSEFKPEHEIDRAISSISELNALPRKIVKKGKCDLILSPESTGAFTSYLLGPMITGKSVQLDASCFKDKLNARIAAESYSLVDDGRIEGGIASATVDDEGTPTRCTKLIERGILRAFLHDISSAGFCEASTTGNARRASETIGRTFLVPPEPSPTNMVTATGEYSFEELVRETKMGIIVNSIGYTFHLVPERGYFSITTNVPSLIVEAGQIKAYTENIAISGELIKTLMKVDAFSKEARQSIQLGSVAALSPYLRIREMDVDCRAR